MSDLSLAHEWLRRASSNLERARAGRVREAVVYEDLCFDCQQAVEKSLKAALLTMGIVFPHTHSIGRLLDLLTNADVEVPDAVTRAARLTAYAADARYPGDYEPVTESEFKASLALAEGACQWAMALVTERD